MAPGTRRRHVFPGHGGASLGYAIGTIGGLAALTDNSAAFTVGAGGVNAV